MNVFFRQTPSGYEWLQTSDEAIASEYYAGSLAEFSRFFAENPHQSHWVMVTSALDVIHKSFSYTAKEKRHIEKAVPFMLEEDVISDIDDLHLITHKTRDQQLAVDAIDKSLISHRIETLKSSGIVPSHCISPYHLLPESEADWVIMYLDEEYVIRTEDQLFAIDHGGVGVCIDAVTDGYAELPGSVELLVFTEDDETIAMSGLPETLKPLITVSRQDYGKLLQAQFGQAKKWNFLTGSFAQSLELQGLLKPWRWVLIGLALVYCIDIGLTSVQSNRYATQIASVKKQTEGLFRQVIPKGVIVDHKRQLGKLLRSIDSNDNASFSRTVSRMIPVLKREDVSINSVNFDGSKSEVRLDMVVPDFTLLEDLMGKIKTQGFDAEIQNSSQQDDKLRVRLRIQG